MRLIGMKVENFRCYSSEIEIRFSDFTAIVGRNDVGKSAIMEALAIFFGHTKPDKDDACKNGNPSEMRITCEFDELPEHVIVDTDYHTSLSAEHLLSRRGTLCIRKTYNGGAQSPSVKAVEAWADHPTADGVSDLLSLKKSDLATRAASLGTDLSNVDRRVNASVRAQIWATCPDLRKAETFVALDSETGKQVWGSLERFLPTFALFKSDRESSDQDSEAQDPLKAAIVEAIKEIEPELSRIQEHVERQVKKIAEETVEKLREMDPHIANSLSPVVNTKKWESLFATSITGDDEIPLNKRGSGVRRLVLLNFFRAKAERAAVDRGAAPVIYAVEEPETSQHPQNQRLLLSALRELSSSPKRQVIITTHTPMLARYVDQENLRFIRRKENEDREVLEGSAASISEIAKSLGVLPDNGVRIFLGVEGPHDINFLKNISKILHGVDSRIPNLEALELAGEIIFVPLGGSNMAVWASKLSPLQRPEFHLCDRDYEQPRNPKYHDHVQTVLARDGCFAVSTNKRELENYIHHQAVVEAYADNGIEIELNAPFADFDDVPELVARTVFERTTASAWADQSPDKKKEKSKAAKSTLNGSATKKMNLERIRQVDRDNEIEGWLMKIAEMMH